jgi:hypothetical protein
MPSHFATHERVHEYSATQCASTAPRQWLQPVSPPTLEAFAANPALLRFSSPNNAGSPIHEPMDHVPYRLNTSEIMKEYRRMVMELAHDHKQLAKARGLER